MKNIEYYLNLPYVIKVVRLDGGGYFASYDEKGLNEKVAMGGDGASEAEAVSALKEAFICYLEDALSSGDEIPLPFDSARSLSITMPQSLIKKADEMAKSVGISRSALIARAVENYRMP